MIIIQISINIFFLVKLQDPQAQEDIDIRRLKDTQDTLVDPHNDPHIQDRYENLNIYFTWIVFIPSLAKKRTKWISLHDCKHGLRTHEGSIPNSLRPKFKSYSQINIWDLGIKA